MRVAVISAIEYHLSQGILSSEQLANEFPEWSIEKIDAKAGITERHIAAESECSSDLAVEAARQSQVIAVPKAPVNSYYRKALPTATGHVNSTAKKELPSVLPPAHYRATPSQTVLLSRISVATGTCKASSLSVNDALINGVGRVMKDLLIASAQDSLNVVVNLGISSLRPLEPSMIKAIGNNEVWSLSAVVAEPGVIDEMGAES
jgi:hypothetical protein